MFTMYSVYSIPLFIDKGRKFSCHQPRLPSCHISTTHHLHVFAYTCRRRLFAPPWRRLHPMIRENMTGGRMTTGTTPKVVKEVWPTSKGYHQFKG
jgi:hypothetical protein